MHKYAQYVYMQLVWLLYSCLWHASGILHIATDFSQAWGSYPPTWTSQCGLQNPRGLCSKVYLGQMGSCRTLDQTMVEKSALMSGTTDQLGVLVECPIPYYSQKGKQTTMA